MDFFQSQDDARKKTFRLVLLFILAVISLVVLTNIIIMMTLGYLQTETLSINLNMSASDWKLSGFISAVVIIIISGASLTKMASLSSGGEQVAEMLGGQLLTSVDADSKQRVLLNVVAEMAIASGTPVPPVYFIEERGINAFAAGYNSSDAVIGITRGAIETLDRDELQGVIAHEFSHILNGDMRLNIRLMGILHGILVIGLIGRVILSLGSRSRYRRRSSRESAGSLAALGFGLLVVGYAGSFFGNMIKSAVSRQREYLADASAVQFTRNPQGIGHALMQIGASENGSLIENPKAEQISHCLFSSGFETSFASFFATHPPLSIRIKQILPNWDGEYPVARKAKIKPTATAEEQKSAKSESRASAAAMAASILMAQEGVGRPSPEHVEYAKEIVDGMPSSLREALSIPYGARAAIYYVLLNEDEIERENQFTYLSEHADPAVYTLTKTLASEQGEINEKFRLPLIDMALPALRQLSTEQFNVFRHNVNMLVSVDDKQNLFEWILQKILLSHLDRAFGIVSHNQKITKRLFEVKYACRTLLSILIYTDSSLDIDKSMTFKKAAQALDIKVALADEETLTLADLDMALNNLRNLAPLKKPLLLKACAICITADNTISVKETELYRAISETLDCPMPPLLVK